ncbi:MAG TPA: cytochrome c oxidase accessory protein CcoG [Longimicrobiales bacterium]|nr:cytochrome c oxidase accessory protein CcoG [Longimicrobiales bacterium]
MLGFKKTREWVYPQSIQGSFTKLRRWTFLGLHVVLFVTPWLTVRGNPLVRIDIPARRLFLFGSIYTASDTVFLLLLLLFLAFALFFFTAVFGRIWCGYACPQTVFLESWIRPLELWIEGDRISRKRRDAKGVHADLVWRKALKWFLFLVVAFLLAMAMVSLFAGARALWTGAAGTVSYAFVAILTAAWYLDFTWFREQFCNYLCPYARFQSALTAAETLLVSYDEDRGEPRGGGRAAALDGRCIACSKCVVVCPQGIDIRNGFQLECIQCARCIDACTSVMEPLGHETLVRYSSIAADEHRPRRVFRPRTIIYGGLLTALTAASVVLLMGRLPFEANVNRAPGSLFTVDADGWVRNTYLLRIINNGAAEGAVEYRVTFEGLEGAEVLTDVVVLESTQTRTLPLVVRVPADQVDARSIPVRVRITSEDGELVLPTTFTTGASGAGSR